MKHSCSHNCDVCKTRYFPAVHKDSIAALAVVRQNLVVTGSKDMRMALHNVDCGEVLHTWRGHISEVTKVREAERTERQRNGETVRQRDREIRTQREIGGNKTER